MKFYKIVLAYFIEITVAFLILFLFDSIEWFLLYAFVIYLIQSEKRTDCLRKLIRVYQVGNEIKLLAIIKKMNISEEEIDNIFEDNLSDEQKKDLEKDFDDLSLKR
ncbi:hypothetical protein KKG22_02380 [Patescibacteria group bacterium]|nr:hypothetical protein [Patescibacteria group bacterium]MBU1721801.1 hypothetical protein [Patescibacteria group bacterium]MBU1900847.1 hypothetical protein [Patescibacteria group bacterium]